MPRKSTRVFITRPGVATQLLWETHCLIIIIIRSRLWILFKTTEGNPWSKSPPILPACFAFFPFSRLQMLMWFLIKAPRQALEFRVFLFRSLGAEAGVPVSWRCRVEGNGVQGRNEMGSKGGARVRQVPELRLLLTCVGKHWGTVLKTVGLSPRGRGVPRGWSPS